MRALKIGNKITIRDEESLGRYLKDIAKIKLLTPKEELDLGMKAQRGDKNAMDRLVSANLRFVVSVAKQYQSYGIGLSDLICAGNEGLIRAAEKFDPTKGFKFISYAVWWIRQSITLAVNEHSRLVRIPANCEDAINEYNKVKEKLEQQLQREPSFEEIAEHLTKEVNIDTNRNTLLNGHSAHKSLDQPVNEEESSSLVDLLVDENVSDISDEVDTQLQHKQLINAIKRLRHLESKVVLARYGLDGKNPRSFEEIGYELNNLTGERIRQIHDRAILMLRRRKSLQNILKEYAED